MALPNEPYTRREVYLSNIAGQNTALPAEPYTREEEYLDYIAKNGGGGGTGEGDMKKSVYDSDLAVSGAGGIKAYVTGAIADKVDKVDGKGLSTNDYDDTEKAAVAANTNAISGIKDGTDIDSFGDVEIALADKVSKSQTAGLLKNDGTVDTTEYAELATEEQHIETGTTASVGYMPSALIWIEALTGTNGSHLFRVKEDVTVSAGDNWASIKSTKLTETTVTEQLSNHQQQIRSNSTALTKAYNTDDTAETAIDDADYFPYYDTSATAKRKTLWSNIKSVLKTYFDTLYGSLSSVTAIEGKIPSGASSSNKMATASDVTGLQDNVIANTELIKDTVGWSGKNGFNSENAVKATDFVSANNNGIISFKDVSTAQWSSTYIGYFDVIAGQTYLLTGTNAVSYGRFALGLSATSHPASAYDPHVTIISGTSNIESFELQNPVKYTANATERIYLWYCSDVNVGSHTTFSTGIMNRKADILDGSFEPYFGSTSFPRSEQAVLGAKNVLALSLAEIKSANTSGTWSGNVYTHNDTTFTVNNDFTVSVQTAGTGASGVAQIELTKNFVVKTDNKYVVSGTFGGSNTKYEIQIIRWTGTENLIYAQNFSGDTPIVNADNNKATVKILVRSGVIISTPTVFEPMIRLATDSDDTYAPYAMTNKELTELVFTKRELTSADDLDDIKDTGIYSISSSPTNAPESASYCTLIVKKRTDNNITQMIIAGEGKLYTRAGGASSWQSWYKYTSTVVS